MSPDDTVRPGDDRKPDRAASAEDDERRVGEVLAAAGSASAPMPPEVTERLEALITDLEAQRSGEEPVPGHVATGEAAERPRPRRAWTRLLVAAALISLAGFALGNLVDRGADEAADTGQAESSGVARREPATAQGGASPGSASVKGGQDTGSVRARLAPSRLHTASLTADVQRVEDAGLARPATEPSAAWRRACVRPDTGAGDEWSPVTLDGEDAVLVLRAPAGGRRAAEVFTCDDGDTPVETTTVHTR